MIWFVFAIFVSSDHFKQAEWARKYTPIVGAMFYMSNVNCIDDMLMFVLVWTDASIAIYSNQNVYRSEFLHRALLLNTLLLN